MLVFVLAGQSNMAGRGILDSHSDGSRSDEDIDPLVLALEGLGETSAWRPAQEPIHRWIDSDELRSKCSSLSSRKPGVGPGISFGKALAKTFCSLDHVSGHVGQDESSPLIGLIPTAVGGTRIEFWCPGGILFSSMLEQVKIGMMLAENAGYSPRLGGLLFYQGESDALDEELANNYERCFESFLQAVRSHLGASLPVVVCAIGGADHRVPHKQTVRAVHLAAPSRHALVACVDAADLPLLPDGLHLTADAHAVLGPRLAEAWARIAPPDTLPGAGIT